MQQSLDDDVATVHRYRVAGQPLVIINQSQMAALISGDRSVRLPDLVKPVKVNAYALIGARTLPPLSVKDPQGYVRGRHFLAWMPVIKQLKRNDQLDEALTLLLECVAAVEVVEGPLEWPAPGWTKEAAIVYRKQKNIAGEVVVLQRWVDAAEGTGRSPSPTHPIVQRLDKARALLSSE